MSESHDPLARAHHYAKSKRIELEEKGKLGHGTDGTVWATSRASALKLFEHCKGYDNELACYRRLGNAGIHEIRGLAVPRLVDFDDSIMAVEMTIVQPPYVLDFGKVYFDHPPPYWSDEPLRQTMHAEGRELFGRRWPEVLRVLAALQALGIYYVDPKPANINFGDD
ncbi:MAG TPA: hypothetical protein VHD36_07895 [Pirellulales bacterium]|nr:hypothetical protein [Pirellulales bacterium]